MIPLYLKLRNFRGISAGMGRDEIELDLSSLPPGLTAITGENGAGKTSVMDNLHPFRLMPYKLRKSPGWGPGSFSYYDQCYGNAQKEFHFEMDGIRYRSVVNIDCDRKKQEAVLYRDGVALNDGKASTYDDAVVAVCGSPNSFFTSVFRAQGARNLSDYARGDIMSVFAEQLGVDHIREQGDKCREAVRKLTQQVELLRASIRSAQQDIAAADETSQKISELEQVRDSRLISLKGYESRLAEAQDALSALEARQAAQESDAARLVILRKQATDERVRHLDVITGMDAMKSGHLREEQVRMERFNSTQSALEAKIAAARLILADAELIRLSASDVPGMESDLADMRSRIATMRAELVDVQAAISAADVQRSTAVTKHLRASKDAELLVGIDCRGDRSGWQNEDCKLIKGAVESKAMIGTYLVAIEQADAKLAELRPTLASLQDAIADAEEEVTGGERALANARRKASLLPEVDRAEWDIIEWESDLSSLLIEKQSYVETCVSRSDELSASRDSEMLRHSMAVADIDADISSVPAVPDLADALRLNAAAVGQAENFLAMSRSALRTAELELAQLQERISVDDKRVQVAAAEANIATLNERISTLSVLAKACSNDGIIALELDDAAPNISTVVNDLLWACYGPRFSVRLVTQVEKADGGMKEAFDILVTDSERGTEKSITEMSGGENSWLNDAITRAIALYNVQCSGKKFGALFTDEVDGSLDTGKKMEFVNVKRKSLVIGGFRNEYFITHTKELIDMADARIMLNKGGVSIC